MRYEVRVYTRSLVHVLLSTVVSTMDLYNHEYLMPRPCRGSRTGEPPSRFRPEASRAAVPAEAWEQAASLC